MLGYLSYKLKQANRILNLKNLEKHTFIQEIHHRVKNNLQFVSSLMNMQITSSHNPNYIDALTDATRRIRAMALVHEMLCNQNELQGLDIKQYLSELIHSITDIVNTKDLQIKFIIEVESLYFNTNKSIALGMITSELISNSIKYAFVKTDNPEIKILLSLNSATNQVNK